MYDFNFGNPVKAYVGRGKALEADRYVVGARLVMVTDPIVSKLPFYAAVKAALGGRVAGEYSEVSPNPQCEAVDAIAAIIRETGADGVVAVGGGSTLDAAKAAAVVSGGSAATEEYVAGALKPASGRKVSLTLMPTTAGTGSEMTNVAVVTNGKIKKKVALVSDAFYCDIAVIDPDLTKTMPFKVAAASGFDALCHAVEALWNKVATPPSDALALMAIGKVMKNLEAACNGDEAAGEEMAIASYLAGFAFNQTRTTVCHAISYHLTARYGIDHGTACTFTLVPFLRYNLEPVRDKFDMAGAMSGLGDADGLIAEIERLYGVLKMPRRLAEYNVPKEDIAEIAAIAMTVPSIKLTPREVTEAAVVEVLTLIA